MSSRSGSRPQGSDGNDFMHREQVASQYVISVKLKSKLKPYLYINLILSSIQAVFIVASHTQLIQAEPLPWQYMWLASFIPSVIGLMALPRNKQLYLRLSNTGTVALGTGGMLFGMLHHYGALKEWIATGETPPGELFFGDAVPLVLCLYGVFITMVIFYLVTVYYANALISSWDSKKSR